MTAAGVRDARGAPPAGDEPADPPGIDGVGRTAFVIARFRAEEAACDHPLVEDPYARLFTDPAAEQAVADMMALLPAARQWVRLRTKYFDESVTTAVANGARQVVLLGAGFDTRALRCPHADTRFFEVDKPAVLDFKARVLLRAGVATPGVPVPCDYLAEDPLQALEGAGFDPGVPAHVIWEGNSAYLPLPESVALLCRLRDGLRQVTVAFDYLHGAVVRGETGVPGLNALLERFRVLGSPWSTGFDEGAETLAGPAGFAVLEDFRMIDLARRYGVPPGPGADALDWYAVAMIRHPG